MVLDAAGCTVEVPLDVVDVVEAGHSGASVTLGFGIVEGDVNVDVADVQVDVVKVMDTDDTDVQLDGVDVVDVVDVVGVGVGDLVEAC